MLRSTVRKIYKKFGQILFSSREQEYAQLATFLSKREVSRINQLPRRRESATRLFEQKIYFPDGYWFLHSMNEIFVEEVYKFQASVQTPLIIDCGANIGLSVIYFKKLFPSASIIAFEPDEKIFKRLADNIAQFNYDRVELVNKGVWNANTTLSFIAEGTLGGRVTDNEKEARNVISIQAVRLKDYLNQTVDFLKIDIEGAEYEVLTDCEAALRNVKLLFVEYHSTSTMPQRLNEILTIISTAGFRYYIREAARNVKYPFVDGRRNWFDLQLNIFCYRNN
jgi:FkbM family methyltransferase